MFRFSATCTGLALVAFATTLPALSQKALEPDNYTRWLLTIPADTKIQIKSRFGNYQVPIGYLGGRLSFHQNPFAKHKNVSRYDAFQQQEWIGFAFNYWVPDGGMVWHSQPQVRENRPIEPAHMVRTREQFVVKMHSMDTLDAKFSRKPDMSVLPRELDVVLPAKPVFANSVAFEGATRDGKDDNYLRIYIECMPGNQLCEGWFVIDRRQMLLRIRVPRDAADLMLDAAKTAARLLDTWEEAKAQ